MRCEWLAHIICIRTSCALRISYMPWALELRVCACNGIWACPTWHSVGADTWKIENETMLYVYMKQ
jgi:hypothetical protein